MRFKLRRDSYLHVTWVDQDNMLQGVIHNIPLAPRTGCTQTTSLVHRLQRSMPTYDHLGPPPIGGARPHGLGLWLRSTR